jgi:hypothetical protein
MTTDLRASFQPFAVSLAVATAGVWAVPDAIPIDRDSWRSYSKFTAKGASRRQLITELYGSINWNEGSGFRTQLQNSGWC